MKTWNIYIAEHVYTKGEDGNGYKNVRSLTKIDGIFHDFTKDVYPKIEEIKAEMVKKGAWLGCLSRGEDWCVDCLSRYATEQDTERDFMFPNIIGIEIISTPYTLKLVASKH